MEEEREGIADCERGEREELENEKEVKDHRHLRSRVNSELSDFKKEAISSSMESEMERVRAKSGQTRSFGAGPQLPKVQQKPKGSLPGFLVADCQSLLPISQMRQRLA